MARAAGNSPIQSHCPLGVDPWPSFPLKHSERSDQTHSGLLTKADLNINSSLLQPENPSSGNMKRGVFTGDDDFPESCPDHGIRTWRRLPKMTAGFKSDKQSGSPAAVTCCRDRMDFGMRFSESLVISFGDQMPLIINDYSSDHRVWFDHSPSEFGQLQRMQHDTLIVGEWYGWLFHRTDQLVPLP